MQFALNMASWILKQMIFRSLFGSLFKMHLCNLFNCISISIYVFDCNCIFTTYTYQSDSVYHTWNMDSFLCINHFILHLQILDHWGVQYMHRKSQNPEILLMAEILHHLGWRLSHYLQGSIHPRWLFGISEPSTVCMMAQLPYIALSQSRIPIASIWEWRSPSTASPLL